MTMVVEAMMVMMMVVVVIVVEVVMMISLASQTHIRKMSGLALLHWQCGRDKRLSFKFPLHAIG